ncbi:FAD dependent oxidoreductase [Humitalea rosea]|uniref:FAD dependent oxidoreductase n=1 Tax=Humitalea rosea TaxID=990373 RepID=A0A2W7HU51_9PROT|nr:FAD-dependent oxidoreductase [Humitalea rosea]PZW37737.1 FAD dependent oxidoreductase [Humitalea rosea]
MRFAIVGGGWYGCHLATALDALGMQVKLFERHSRLFHEASGNNQFRLHQGFHYPRHHATRMQSRDGFMRFVERYPQLSASVPHNIYAVPAYDSDMDFSTYRLIMTATGVEFSELTDSPVKLQSVSGTIATHERVLMISRSREYFERKLASRLTLNCQVESIVDHGTHVSVDGEPYDFVIDATWGHLTRPAIDVFYEPTMLLYYEGPVAFPALTFVDGALCSLYPTEDQAIYTLSSVPHTPLGRYASSEEARASLGRVNGDLIALKVAQMEEQISKYYPGFRDLFRFVGPQLAIKTKPIGAHDDRSCSVTRKGRVFNVMSGKIDTIFTATERVLSLLEMSVASDESTGSTLRQDILGMAL